LRRLGALLAAAAQGQGHLALVGGAAGIGKTALVRTLTADAASLGAAVLVGHCYDLSATAPYGPWRELLVGLPTEDGFPSLPAALTEVGDPQPGGQDALFRQAFDILSAVAATRPVVVVLEDLHWTDPASLDLLRFVARRLTNLPLLLVATYRVDELTRRHPLARLLPTLVREAPTARLDLRRLDEAALGALVTSRYPLPDEERVRLIAYLGAAAQGNPFYLQEVLRNLEEERVLCPGEPRWTLGDLNRVRVPALLKQVIEGRLARLGDAVWDHLSIGAVIGQRVPLDVWQMVGALTEDEVLQTVERAVEVNVLEADDDGVEVRFAHALVREVLYEGILPPRRRVWHRRVAEAAASLSKVDPDAIAYHFAQARDARAADWLVRAGKRALGTYAWLTARDRFAEAAALLEGDAARASERGWLIYRMGRLLRMSDPRRGVEYLVEAERVARSTDDPLLAAYALFDRGLLLCILTELERGMEAMEAGVAAIEALPVGHASVDPALGEWIADAIPAHATLTSVGDTAPAMTPLASRQGTMACWLGHTGHFAEARAVGEAYLAQAAGMSCHDALVLSGVGDAEFAVALAEAAMGRPAAARAAHRRAQGAFRAIDHYYLVGLVLSFELTEVVLPYGTTDVAARRGLAVEAAAQLAKAGGALESAPDAHLHELDVLIIEGAWAEAEQRARSALVTAHPLRRLPAMFGLAVLARWLGQPAEAWGHLNVGLPRGPAAKPGSHPFRHTTVAQRLAADLALDAKDLPTTVAWLAAHDAWLTWSGAVRGQAESRRLWARYHRVAGDLDRARQHASEAVAMATELHQPLVLLAAHRLLGEIEIDAGRFDATDSNLTKSLALADACAAPFERALTLLALAELRVAEGKAPEATRLLAEVRAIGQPLGATPMLAIVDALAAQLAALPARVDPGLRLSVRETEVLRLVAAGRSNPEIANLLFVSPRTVTTHLTHIFAKLDVEGRAAAVALALRHELL
jgi:DNA-binding CsgD family transcriptional regulator